MTQDLRINLADMRISDVWHRVYCHHKGGGLRSVIYSSRERLEINAEFVNRNRQRAEFGRALAPSCPMFEVVGGGQRMTPTQFGERLDRELRALQVALLSPEFVESLT